MKIILGALAAMLIGGCACSSSYRIVKGLPSDKVPRVDCYISADETLPPFISLREEWIPKRAILTVSLADHLSEKPVLHYEGRLKAMPRYLDFTPLLHGDLFTVEVSDRQTHQSWTVEFRRGPDGQFRLIRERGDFRR